MKKTLYVVAGPNGAGKSTHGQAFIPQNIKLVDFDKMYLDFYQKSPYSDIDLKMQDAQVEAENTFQKLKNEALITNTSFAYETNFNSSMAFDGIPSLFQKENYQLELLFFLTTDEILNINRVVERVKSGGHNVPVWEIKKRWKDGLSNLNAYFDKFDVVTIIQAELKVPISILTIEKGKITSSLNDNHSDKFFTFFKEKLPRIHDSKK